MMNAVPASTFSVPCSLFIDVMSNELVYEQWYFGVTSFGNSVQHRLCHSLVRPVILLEKIKRGTRNVEWWMLYILQRSLFLVLCSLFIILKNSASFGLLPIFGMS